MSLSRWKILACTLTVGVGGLAVFATPPMGEKKEAPKEPAPLPSLTVKPATPTNGDDTPAPANTSKDKEFDLDVPAVPTVSKTEEPPKKPSSEPVFEPVSPPPAPAILPVKGEETKAPEKAPMVVAPPLPPAGSDKGPVKPDVTPVPESPKPSTSIPPLDLDTPAPPPPATKPAPKPEIVPPPIADLDLLPPVGSPAKPMSPPAEPKPDSGTITPPVNTYPTPMPTPPVPPLGVPKVEGPKPPMTNMPHVENPSSAKLKMLLRVGDGQPRFEIRNSASSELLLKVYGEKVEMQAPPESRSSLAGVTAIGRVRFTAPGIDGTCDHLTILSGTGEVLMKGNIRMKTKHGKTWSEMTAEKMVYQIGASGLASPESPRPAVRPASYIPD